ncbi:MAG: outer membrane lipoprotein-sorting protein [Deltaproteobacteria bacterium]|nr:outer membrane lipoprotein-sorting protein [Deltaproteobacteria bacterium]
MSLAARLLVVACLVVASGSVARADGGRSEAQELLARAFSNRYELDFAADIDLVMYDAGGQRRVRRFRALSKIIADRTHSIGRLIAPVYLRGMTILTIEAKDRGHDAFVYLPSLGKVRRVSTAQRNDAFLGSDVTYEDLERHRVGEYRLAEPRITERAGERAYAIGATPRRPGHGERIEFIVSAADAAILETRHFRNSDAPHRIVSMPRTHMIERGGHILPTRLEVNNLFRSTRTEVVFQNLIVNPTIDERFFSVATLDQKRRLPGESR